MSIHEMGVIIGTSLTVLGALIASFLFFRRPQEDLEKKQAITDKDVGNKASLLAQKEVENKAAVLEKQFNWYMDSNNEKFVDMGKRLDAAFLLAANHTNTVDKKVDELIRVVNSTNIEVAKLGVIITERISRN